MGPANDRTAIDARLLDAAARSLFRLGRVFTRMPRRELLAAPSRDTPDLSAILLVQATEDAEHDGAPATVGTLATRLGIDPSTASRLVAQAERAGYLQRTRQGSDGRVVSLELTDAGRILGGEAARYQRAVYDAVTKDWSETDRATFARLFAGFADGVAALVAGRDAGRPGSGSDGRQATMPAELVAAWHVALNAGDADEVAALCHEHVELVGPRGVATGREIVRRWASDAGIRLDPLRWFVRGNDVVVEQHAAWRDPETGEYGEPIPVATTFLVRDGLLARIARRDTLGAALADGGIDETSEVAAPDARHD